MFTSLNAVLNYVGIPLNSTDTVDENKSRAGQDLMKQAASALKADKNSQVVTVSEHVWSQVGETPAAESGQDHNAEADAQEQQGPRDTLFLYDTSDGMQPFKPAVDAAIGDAAKRITQSGHQVALWNYSSPLNPGVIKGWRNNIAMTGDSDDVANTAKMLGTGGVPQTREALFAASAAMHELDRDVRIVLITTGTSDDNGAPEAAQELRDHFGERITLSVVRVGDNPADDVVSDVAAVVKEARTADQVGPAVAEAVD